MAGFFVLKQGGTMRVLKFGGTSLANAQRFNQVADIVIRQNNNHDIGFKWNNNEYELVTDLMFWNQPYSVDKFLNQVHQRYAFNLITKVSEEQNLQFVEAENQQDGSIRLLLRKVN